MLTVRSNITEMDLFGIIFWKCYNQQNCMILCFNLSQVKL